VPKGKFIRSISSASSQPSPCKIVLTGSGTDSSDAQTSFFVGTPGGGEDHGILLSNNNATSGAGWTTGGNGGASVVFGQNGGGGSLARIIYTNQGDQTGQLVVDGAPLFIPASQKILFNEGAPSINPSIGSSTSSLILNPGEASGKNIVVSYTSLAPDTDNYFSSGASTKGWSKQYINSTITNVAGSVSGSADFTMPEQGSSMKRTIIFCTALVGTATYNFPTAYTHTPFVAGPQAGLATSVSTTAITITGTTSGGFLTVEGF